MPEVKNYTSRKRRLAIILLQLTDQYDNFWQLIFCNSLSLKKIEIFYQKPVKKYDIATSHVTGT
jgi:hypothetical protein